MTADAVGVALEMAGEIVMCERQPRQRDEKRRRDKPREHTLAPPQGQHIIIIWRAAIGLARPSGDDRRERDLVGALAVDDRGDGTNG